MRVLASIVGTLLLSLPIAAVARTSDGGYEIVSAPVADRGKVVEIDGVRSFVAAEGWYVIALGATGTVEVDGDDRYVTYDAPGTDEDSFAWISVHAEPGMNSDIESTQRRNENVLTDFTGFPGTVIERRIIRLGGGNGRKPMGMSAWFTQKTAGQGRVKLFSSTRLPHGVLMLIIDAKDVASAEAVLQGVRIAEGALE